MVSSIKVRDGDGGMLTSIANVGGGGGGAKDASTQTDGTLHSSTPYHVEFREKHIMSALNDYKQVQTSILQNVKTALSTNPNCFATSDKTTAYEYAEVILDDVGVGPDGVINIAPENNDIVNELKKMKL